MHLMLIAGYTSKKKSFKKYTLEKYSLEKYSLEKHSLGKCTVKIHFGQIQMRKLLYPPCGCWETTFVLFGALAVSPCLLRQSFSTSKEIWFFRWKKCKNYSGRNTLKSFRLHLNTLDKSLPLHSNTFDLFMRAKMHNVLESKHV